MKRLFGLNLVWLALVVLAGWVWSLHDQAAYTDRIDHYGLSEAAVKIKSHKAMTLNEAATALATADLGPIQVQFHAGPHRVYLYAQGNYGSLPLTSGQWFSDADLRSPLPVVVVGSDLTDQLTMGHSQQYKRQNGQYVPVLGQLKAYTDSVINQVTFENASGSPAQSIALKQVTVYADSPTIKTQKAKLKTILGGKMTTYHYQNNSATSWWQDTGQLILRCGLLFLGTLALAWIASQQGAALLPRTLATAPRRHALRHLWTQFFAYSGLSLAAGLVIANWFFDLTNRARLIAFAVGLWLVGLAGLYWLLQRAVHQEREDRL